MSFAEALRLVEQLAKACEVDPGLSNLVQAEHDWVLYGDACDPLSPAAPERALKALQRDIYLEVWDGVLSRLDPATSVMVAGGGTGRFALALARRGLRVGLIDASPSAVERAQRHLGAAAAATVGDLERAETLEPGAHGLLLAVEVVCYATDPSLIMQRLRRALRPGGTLLFSVEARPGALFADRDLASPPAVRAVLDQGVVTLPGLKHVHYYTRAEAAALAEQAGLSVRAVDGVCYVPDGPFNGLIDATRLHEPAHAGELLEIERRCRSHPLLRELPRAWAVTAVAA